MTTVDLEKAVQYVRDRGGPIEQTRLRVLLREPCSVAEALQPFEQTQRADGGWSPFWCSSTSAIDATCYRLAQIEPLGIAPVAPVVQKAMEFLKRRQQVDGSWEEEAGLREVAPPWCMPGDAAAKLYVTSNAAYWLSVFAPETPGVATAAAFLARHVQVDGSLASYEQTHWLSLRVLLAAGWSDEAQRLIVRLTRQVADMSASDLAWLGSVLQAMTLPVAARRLLSLVQNTLASKQLTDGHFASDDGPDQDVHVTLEALRASGVCKSLGYIMSLRQALGTRPLIMAAAGILIRDEQGRILLQHRSDNQCWGIPGGSMELGESFEETARREALEETGLAVGALRLLCLRSGQDMYYRYPNGDQIYLASAVYLCDDYSGTLRADRNESLALGWFAPGDYPEHLSALDRPVLEEYAKGLATTKAAQTTALRGDRD